jgi:hypothetical protein
MKEKMPLWFQAAALACLRTVWVATIAWVAQQEQSLQRHLQRRGYFESATSMPLYVWMPLYIVFLGARFIWRFARAEERKSFVGTALYWIGVGVTFAAFFALVTSPARQKVREAGSWMADATAADSPAARNHIGW